MPDDRPLAVVTGSSTGIGRATAVALARAGWQVVIHARQNERGLEETAQLINACGAPAKKILADVSTEIGRSELVTGAFHWRGQVTAWINNAGADVLTTSARELNFERKLRLLLETDVIGTALLSRAVAERMQSQAVQDLKPCIINVGWDQAWLGMADEPGQLFCTTKAAVMAFTSSLALTHGPAIRVNCVAPGWIQTAWGNSADDYWKKRAISESLLARWGRPEDVANTICWLASREAEFVNGQCISINGGRRYARPT